MNAKKHASPLSSKSDLARVDKHRIKAEEYEELPEITDETLARAKVNKGGRPVSSNPQDTAAVLRFAKRYAAGQEETVPAAVVDRLLAGDTPLRVWREHRGMTAAQVATAVAITPAHVSKLESGKGVPSVALLRRLAKVLRVSLEDLVGADPD